MQHNQPRNIGVPLPKEQTTLSNWSKTGRSRCHIVQVKDVAGVVETLAFARERGLSVIPHGAGHSYTDAALNTGGIVLDLTPMRRILAWDAAQGVMRVEPGVTLRDLLMVSWKDGWWPFATPSTPEVTIGGCVAMNVNGKNAWKYGVFGEHVLAIEVMLANGEMLTLTPERDPQFFHAFVGSIGLLGIITSVTVQLQRLPSDCVTIQRRSNDSLAALFALFEEQQESDFIEGWIDGFATGAQFGRGHVTSAVMSRPTDRTQSKYPAPSRVDQMQVSLVRRFGALYRPMFLKSIPLANSIKYWQGKWSDRRQGWQASLLPYTFYPPAAFAGYHALLPNGVETFQAFVPRQRACEVFEQLLRYSQQQGRLPIWCVVKRHRPDPFLLSYQVDGFSLELNYPRLPPTAETSPTLEEILRRMIEMVIEAGGRFYPAKDHFMTQAQYRRSVGDVVVDTFLRLKARYDPEMLLQSDLFHRLFQASPQ